jgi:hypothetical protein
MLHAHFRPFKLKGYKEWFEAVQESVSKVDAVINYASEDPTIEQWCAFLGPKIEVEVNNDGYVDDACPRALAFRYSLKIGYWLSEKAQDKSRRTSNARGEENTGAAVDGTGAMSRKRPPACVPSQQLLQVLNITHL